MKRTALITAAVLLAAIPQAARATQQFAKETLLSCSVCHTASMQLTPAGKGFRNSNLRMMRLSPRGGPAVALRGEVVYDGDPSPSGLPKSTLAELNDFVAGQIADNFTYYADIYNLDAGTPGTARELWVEYAGDRRRSPASVRVMAGLLSLPTPLDAETFRDLNLDYQIWDQKVGANPFDLYDSKNGIQLSVGSEIRGTSVSLLALQGHDILSQIPSDGIDAMVALKHVAGPLVLDAFRYSGRRPTGAIADAFSRTAFGASLYSGRFVVNAVAQSGWDSSANGDGVPISSGGGFLQTRYALGPKTFALARYEGIEDGSGSFARWFTVGAETFIGNAFRLEVEDEIQHLPQAKNTLNVVLGFGFANTGGSQAY